MPSVADRDDCAGCGDVDLLHRDGRAEHNGIERTLEVLVKRRVKPIACSDSVYASTMASSIVATSLVGAIRRRARRGRIGRDGREGRVIGGSTVWWPAAHGRRLDLAPVEPGAEARARSMRQTILLNSWICSSSSSGHREPVQARPLVPRRRVAKPRRLRQHCRWNCGRRRRGSGAPCARR